VADFVQESVDRAKKDKLSQTEALETALRIEQSFLEKKCFEIFIPSHQKVKKVLEKLNQETEEHVERLRNQLEKLTKNK
jgi:bacterioferritin (cytochrome b1)